MCPFSSVLVRDALHRLTDGFAFLYFIHVVWPTSASYSVHNVLFVVVAIRRVTDTGSKLRVV